MADALATRDEFRMAQWSQIIRECRESGLSNREFCRQRGITEKSFYYWLKKIRESLAEQMAPRIVPLEGGSTSTPVDMIRIQFGEASIQVPGKTDVDAIALLLQALQKQCWT